MRPGEFHVMNGSKKERKKKSKKRTKKRVKRGKFISFMHGIVGMQCAGKGPRRHVPSCPLRSVGSSQFRWAMFPLCAPPPTHPLLSRRLSVLDLSSQFSLLTRFPTSLSLPFLPYASHSMHSSPSPSPLIAAPSAAPAAVPALLAAAAVTAAPSAPT